MQLREIYDFLDNLSPFATQASWDNSGLLIGSMQGEVEQIYLSLDIDSSLVEEILPNSLVIAHHPLIFSGLKKLHFDKYPSNLIQKMMTKNCALIAMHTNFDLSHLNRYVISQVLGFNDFVCNEFVCYFEANMPFEDLALHVKNVLGLDVLRCVKAQNFIHRCAFTTGSGGDMISHIEADCFLSGDFKYHQALEAKENKLSLIDMGHFESERYFSACLGEHLKKLPLKAIMSNSKNPFEYK